MKNFVLILLLLMAAACQAQGYKELRDSLTAAAEELAYRPDSLDLRLKKAAWNLRLEQWEYAKEEYDYVLKMDKGNVAALYFRAFANERLGRLKFARLDYESLLAIVPGHFEGRLGLALLNQKDRHYREALDMLNSLCEAFPSRSEAFAARGGVEMERGMLELAEYDFAQAVSLEPENTDYRLSHVDALLKLGRKAEARRKLDELVKMGIPKPSLAEFYIQTK